MNYKDYYKPEHCAEMVEVQVTHLLNKYENKPGILAIEREKFVQYYSVDTKEVLEKSIEYFNKIANHKAFWFYVKDLKKYEKPMVHREDNETVLLDNRGRSNSRSVPTGTT